MPALPVAFVGLIVAAPVRPVARGDPLEAIAPPVPPVECFLQEGRAAAAGVWRRRR